MPTSRPGPRRTPVLDGHWHQLAHTAPVDSREPVFGRYSLKILLQEPRLGIVARDAERRLGGALRRTAAAGVRAPPMVALARRRWGSGADGAGFLRAPRPEVVEVVLGRGMGFGSTKSSGVDADKQSPLRPRCGTGPFSAPGTGHDMTRIKRASPWFAWCAATRVAADASDRPCAGTLRGPGKINRSHIP